MNNTGNLIYYSTNTYLSYQINRMFYKGTHYVWCSPVFNPASLDELNPLRNIPPTSSPHEVYINYRDLAKGNDRHGHQIRQNQLGLKRGARIMLASGKIDESQYQLILYMVKNAPLTDFRPLLYLIPAQMVEGRVNNVPAKHTANVLGAEYRIFDLQEGEFEVLEFKR